MDVKIKTDNLKFKYRVSGIIIADNKLLVEKYTENSYCLPGGYVNIGETSEKSIIRELKEEINIDFKLDKFAGVAENFFTNFRGDKTHAVELYYYITFKDINDINNIDYKRLENDHGKMIQHDLKWIDLNNLNTTELKPLEIRDAIINKTEKFHYIINDK